MPKEIQEMRSTSSHVADDAAEHNYFRRTKNKAVEISDSDPPDLKDGHQSRSRRAFGRIVGEIIDIDSSSSEDEILTNDISVSKDTASNDGEDELESPLRKPRRAVRANIRTIISDSEGSDELAYPEEYDDDSAILVLNDSPSSRYPMKRDAVFKRDKSTINLKCPPIRTDLKSDDESISTRIHVEIPLGPKKMDRSRGSKDDYSVDSFIALSTPDGSVRTPVRTKTPAKKRMTKKAIQEQKQASLAAYAKNLFTELNGSVFTGRLPTETELKWNVRLQSTAGRAKWHRSDQGVETTSIELSTKVLDNEERIRNTLSHEMCHLACWVIDRKPKENHGPAFLSWADKVMDQRPDIHITTKHSYDINYRYEWKCQTKNCGKIYGRHSKSIDPTKSVCSVCKGGELVPLFKTRTRRKVDSASTSKETSILPRDSPTRVKESAFMVNPTFIEISSDSSETEDTEGSVYLVDSRSSSPSILDEEIPKERHTGSRKNGSTVDVTKLILQMSITDLGVKDGKKPDVC